MRNRDQVEQSRLRDRIGNFYKYMDNALIHNPDPRSAHYMNGKFYSKKKINSHKLFD